MTTFGTRLKTERKRLQLTQVELAALGGLQKNAQIDYEKGESSPNADYLMKVAQAGVDIGFLFYNTRSGLGASQQVTELLTVLSELPPAQQAMSFAMLNMFRRSAGSTLANTADADAIWRAARLFEQFLSVDDRARTVIETSARGMVALMGAG